jgi:hypothetical protein
MSTENTNQTTENNAVQASAKIASAPTQPTQTTAKKVVRKTAKKAPAKAPAKAPSKAPAKAPIKAKKVAAKKTPQKTTAKVNAVSTSTPVVETKHKKPKLVRDSFTFPKDEYQAIAGLKQKALGLKHSAKKSEILRAGLKLLSSLNDKAFLAALTNVPALKTGRPAKS